MRKLLSLLLLVILLVLPKPLLALLTLEEEDRIGREVLQELSKQTELIQDQELLYYVNALGRFLQTKGVGFSPFNFQFFWIKDPTFNAFSVPGGYIFLNTGLFETLESEDELASILAHEMAHNLARHVAKRIETIKRMQIATTAMTLAAIILGGGKAGEIAGATSTALAQTKLLSYSRHDEEEADRLGSEILSKAGFNPQAMLRIMEKMMKLSNFAIELNYRYLLTHPLSQERYVYLKNLTERMKFLPQRDLYAFSHDEVYFKRLKSRVKALSNDPGDLMVKIKTEIKRNDDPFLRYTYALALARLRYFKPAEEEMLRALKNLPDKPYFLIDLAELYYLSGKYGDALEVLKRVNIEESPPIAKILTAKLKYMTARSLAETGEISLAYSLMQELSKDEVISRDYVFFYHFGILCARLDKQGEFHYYFGKHYELKVDFKSALFHYKRALSFLPNNSKMYTEAEEWVKLHERKKGL